MEMCIHLAHARRKSYVCSETKSQQMPDSMPNQRT
jgi:hypothetical protein